MYYRVIMEKSESTPEKSFSKLLVYFSYTIIYYIFSLILFTILNKIIIINYAINNISLKLNYK